MRVKKKDVPIEVRRLAAQHLESLRGSGLGLNTDDLYLGDDVCPMYRPDMKDPAYYEFQVLKATQDNPDGRVDLTAGVTKVNILDAAGYKKVYATPELSVAGPQVQGFIIVSTGEHDFPIPHWSVDHAPVSVALEKRAPAGKKVAKVYKLDALAYLAEDSGGAEVGSVGQKPSLIKGAPEDLSAGAGKIGFHRPATFDRSAGPDLPQMKGRALKRGGARPPTALKVQGLPAWTVVKRDYLKSFKPFLTVLQSRAQRSWKVHKMVNDFGEGIQAGTVHNVALLEKEASVEVSGEAAEHVKVRIVKRPNGTACVELACSDPGLGHEVSFDLRIRYSGKLEEKLGFFIFSPSMPSQHKTAVEEG